VGSVQYDPWGVPTTGTPQPFGFTGELHSAGQVSLRARWYAPGPGRFVSEDPFAGWSERPYSLHAYQYAYSNPVRWTDPSGQCTDLGFGSSIYCEPGEEPRTPAEAEALCGPKPPSHPRTGPTSICNPQRGAWEPLLKTGTIVVGGLPSLGRALPRLGRLPQIGKAGREMAQSCLGLTRLLLLSQSSIQVQADTQTQSQNRRSCDRITIPASCVQDFAQYPDTSFQCFRCATNVARKIQIANCAWSDDRLRICNRILAAWVYSSVKRQHLVTSLREHK